MIKIIGIGNPLLCDDGFGLRVAEELKKRNIDSSKTFVMPLPTPSPWDIYEVLREGEFFIIIDAFETGDEGVVETFPLEQVKSPSNTFKTIHDVNINQVLDLLRLNGIEAKGIVVGTKGFEFKISLELSERMKAMVSPVADKVCELLNLTGTATF